MQLASADGADSTRQPDELDTIEALIAASEEHNEFIHGVLRSITERCVSIAHAPACKLSKSFAMSGPAGCAPGGEDRGGGGRAGRCSASIGRMI